MIKQTVTYEDWDGDSQTEDFYFHISKLEILDNHDLQDKFESVLNTLGGEARALETSEIKQIFDTVKELMRVAYGVRSEDGKRFQKSPELWAEFVESPAYEALVLDLFSNPEKMGPFMTSIFPKDVQKHMEEDPEIKALMEGAEVENVDLPVLENTVAKIPEKEIESIRKKDPREMSHEELLEAYRLKNQERGHTV